MLAVFWPSAVSWLIGSKVLTSFLEYNRSVRHWAEKLHVRDRGLEWMNWCEWLQSCGGRMGVSAPRLLWAKWGCGAAGGFAPAWTCQCQLLAERAQSTAKLPQTRTINLDQKDYREQIWRQRKRVNVSLLLTWQKAPGGAPVAIGLAADRLSLPPPSVQIPVRSCLLLVRWKACH